LATSLLNNQNGIRAVVEINTFVKRIGDSHLQGQFAAYKDILGDMINEGVFTPSTSRPTTSRGT
jgi:hypothetical protein